MSELTSGKLLEILTDYAKEFRSDSGSYERNTHMHTIKKAPTQDDVDAVLVGFLNYVAMKYGMDYGLYTRDLQKK